MDILSLRLAAAVAAVAVFGAACGEARDGRGGPADSQATSGKAALAPAPAPDRTVEPPARFADGLAAQNAARTDAGLKPLAWSAAREEEAKAVVGAISALTCSRAQTERMAASKDAAGYWAPAVRQLDGTGAVQPLSAGFVISEWMQERAHASASGCDQKGACENYSRLIRASARTVGCAIALCHDQSQVWACRYGD